ncbi:hypothetical protein GCM10022261_18460 [Brevibacterium daeguense]|uniref:Uncharacterized protein n=1 Tax=Brevibacterium daeguense TaxID=909936 RepID=A0ABP8EK08_9MICO|nr:hypothetical protein [Brevibacterium daeguense]
MTDPDRLRTLFTATELPISEERIEQNAETFSGLLALIAAVRDHDYGDTVPATPFRASWS